MVLLRPDFRVQGTLLLKLALLRLFPGVESQGSRTPTIGSPAHYPDNEKERIKGFNEVHGEWPPPWTYPGGKLRIETEAANWTEMMETLEDEARVMQGQWQWERWLDLAQMHLAKNYSEKGYHQVKLEDAMHNKLAGMFRRSYVPDERPEGPGAYYLQGRRDMWHAGKLGRKLMDQLLDIIRRKIAEWIDLAPSDLVQTSYYGFRVFRNGSIVKPHVDKFPTNVLTAIYCLDIKQDAGAPPWLMGYDVGFDGGAAWVDLQPGELFLYESAKLPHARPNPFIGSHFAALAVHFAPKEWRLENWDRIYAVPPDYQEQRTTPVEWEPLFPLVVPPEL